MEAERDIGFRRKKRIKRTILDLRVPMIHGLRSRYNRYSLICHEIESMPLVLPVVHVPLRMITAVNDRHESCLSKSFMERPLVLQPGNGIR